MKYVYKCIAVLLLVVGLALSACGGPSAPGGEKCQGGLCIDLELTEPIYFNKAAPLTITVETEEDIPALEISLGTSDSDIVIAPQRKWIVDAKAGYPIVITSTVTFPEEGYHTVIGGVTDTRTWIVVEDSVSVYISQIGGTVNPPQERTPGEPELVYPITSTIMPGIPSPIATPTFPPSPLAHPTPWNREIERLKPPEIVTHCGWAPGKIPPTTWENAKVWVEIPKLVPLDTAVPVVIGFETEEQTGTIRATLTVCPTEPQVQVEGKHEWAIKIQAGHAVTFTTTLRFTQPGEFAVRAAAHDPVSGQVIDGGQRTQVLAEKGIVPSKSSGGWQQIAAQHFEGFFPPPVGRYKI